MYISWTFCCALIEVWESLGVQLFGCHSTSKVDNTYRLSELHVDFSFMSIHCTAIMISQHATKLIMCLTLWCVISLAMSPGHFKVCMLNVYTMASYAMASLIFHLLGIWLCTYCIEMLPYNETHQSRGMNKHFCYVDYFSYPVSYLWCCGQSGLDNRGCTVLAYEHRFASCLM